MPLRLNWLDKVNSPQLLAFLQQYGVENYLSAEEINDLRDAINELSVGSGSSNGSAPPPYSTFRWIMRGTDHNSPTPIAGDVFEGVISQVGEPLQFSSSLIWNGIGPHNNTNLANFEIRQST
jgi:hypothetical protein